MQIADKAAVTDDNTNAILRAAGPQLAIAETLNKNLDRAEILLQKCWKSFVLEWSGLHPLAITSREAALQRTRSIAEIDMFVSAAKDARSSLFSNAYQLCDRWAHQFLSAKKDPLYIWDDIHVSRKLCLKTLQDLCTTSMKEHNPSINMLNLSLQKDFLIEMASAARKQHNQDVCNNSCSSSTCMMTCMCRLLNSVWCLYLWMVNITMSSS